MWQTSAQHQGAITATRWVTRRRTAMLSTEDQADMRMPVGPGEGLEAGPEDTEDQETGEGVDLGKGEEVEEEAEAEKGNRGAIDMRIEGPTPPIEENTEAEIDSKVARETKAGCMLPMLLGVTGAIHAPDQGALAGVDPGPSPAVLLGHIVGND